MNKKECEELLLIVDEFNKNEKMNSLPARIQDKLMNDCYMFLNDYGYKINKRSIKFYMTNVLCMQNE